MNVKPASILVVDDNELNRDLLVRRLNRQGHTVTVAINGREALAHLENAHFDLILLDIMMPEMNGYEVLAHLKADPVLQHIPVIVISAANETESIIKGIELGAEDYLVKPFNPLFLRARINASLEKKRLHDKEQARLAELATMQQIDRELNDTLDLKRAMDITLDWALQQAGGEAGLMGVLDDGCIHIITARGYTGEANRKNLLPDAHPAIHKALTGDELAYISNVNGAGLLAKTQSQIAIPLHRETAVIAILLLESTQADAWREDAVRFLNRLGSHAAIAIANAQLYEAVQAANEAKTEFVSFVSHELKTPMTSIMGYADLLRSGNFGPINEMQTTFINTIEHNVARMNTLVSDLTDISRIEAGQLSLETERVDFSAVVTEVLASIQAQIEAKEQTLLLEIPENLPEIWGDHTRLVQILTNLVSNANKYTPENGRITIRAQAIEHIDEGSEALSVIHVSVADTGLGIKEEEQDAIFSKFFRADDREALKSPGTGLGLSITKNLVEMHDGRIWFESQYRQGTIFHVLLPVAAQR
jgi:signal transduction histidine kinase/DNA-binding NarL/FixJ family response regulator